MTFWKYDQMADSKLKIDGFAPIHFIHSYRLTDVRIFFRESEKNETNVLEWNLNDFMDAPNVFLHRSEFYNCILCATLQ